MKIQINGEAVEMEKTCSIASLLVEHNVAMPDMVSVELNGEILSRDKFVTTVLKDGDSVEFLYFMGGGQRTYKKRITNL